MTDIKRHRIKFYSKEDLSSAHNMSKIEEALDNYKQNNEMSLNCLIELYNIKLHFDNQLVNLNLQEKNKLEI